MSQYDGIALKDSKIKENFDIIIVGIIKSSGQTIINPNPDTVLSSTDMILLMGEVNKMDRFKETLPSLCNFLFHEMG